MAWYWPRIDDQGSAEGATKPAVGTSAFVAAVTGLLAVLSIVYHRPIFGLTGGSIVDALLFVVIAWRIKKMSRTWAVLGLLIYLLEIGFNLASSENGAIGIVGVAFILTYVGAVRGTFAFHRYRRMSHPADPPAMGVA
jgi:hypothetical protein